MSAKVARARLVLVLADDHGRGTRHLTHRDIATQALDMFVEPAPLDRLFKPSRLADGGTMRIKLPDAPR